MKREIDDTATGITVDVADGIAIVMYDQPGSPVNTLNTRIAPVFDRIFDMVDGDSEITALVLLSAKRDSWIAGADIAELSQVATPMQGEDLSRGGQRLLNRLASLRKPTIAAMHGSVLGGGLETALACTHRIATEHPKTILAFPEVQLGLIPGAGGTQRLPHTVGLQAALDMILTGKNIRAKRALSMGLVHELVHPAVLREVALRRARELGRGERPALRDRPGTVREHATTTLLEDNSLGRRVVFRQARETVLKKTKGAYPAPLFAIDAIQKGYADGFEAGLLEEASRFGDLAVHPVTKQLVYLFFATTALKKDTGLDDGETATGRSVRKAGILGAGFMGAGIASVAVQAGTLVRLKDASLERVNTGWRAVRDVLRERLKKKQITRAAMDDMMSLVGGTTDYSGFSNTDLVIEAVFEDLAVKHAVLRETEAVAPNAIFASNTSTIPIADIARASAHPERVIGMHFFSPVHKMPLLEVIVTPETSAETTATVVQYGRLIGKTVIVVRDGPGFYVNRILSPYINESGKLLDQGAGIEAVDDAMTAFGFPVGPFTLLDEVGLDIAGKSGPIMEAAFGARMARATTLERVVASGRLGRKSRRGFYRYDTDGKRQGIDETIYSLTPVGSTRRSFERSEMQRRAVFAMLNEAVRCLEEGIIRSPRDGDIGAVFGIGFPPFLGGPFRHLDTLGLPAVVRQLDELNQEFPGRFEPAALLRRLSESGTSFHPSTGTAP
ncbi:MAG TPA: fatty acid oxidation complex subunit alpha FadJ [Gemmatimonas sp.]|nr:fatty acid oxidation complex subunit alpha FadJ [Gemmatimonas sp.]